MAIEQTVQVWWDSFILTLAFDVEKMIAFMILFIVGAIIAKWGRNIIANILKQIFRNKKLQEKTGIQPSDLEDKEGWKGLIYRIPDIFRIFILIFIVMIGLDLLEFEQGSRYLGEVFLFIPNIIAVVMLLWIGMWLHNLGKELIDGEKFTIFKGEKNIPKYGFFIVLWGVIISISLTQLGIGQTIVPTIIAGIMGVIITVTFALRNVILHMVQIESLKNLDVKEGQNISFIRDPNMGGLQYRILKIGLTHIKLVEAKSGKTVYMSHEGWVNRFYIENPDGQKT